MAVTVNLYGNFFNNALNANTPDLEGAGNLECMLLDANHTFDEANNTVSDISANEITDADYSRQALTTVAVTQSTGTVNIDADDITFGTNVSISANHAVIYTVGTDDTDSYLMEHINFGELQESVNGEFSLVVDTNGLYDVVT